MDTKDHVITSVGRAVEILYNLDLYLSNSYSGKNTDRDKAIHHIRFECLKPAMEKLTIEAMTGEALDKL